MDFGEASGLKYWASVEFDPCGRILRMLAEHRTQHEALYYLEESHRSTPGYFGAVPVTLTLGEPVRYVPGELLTSTLS